MEANNVKKISLSTFFLVLAIIVIIAMGIFILKLNKDKTTEIQKSSDLQSQVNNLQEKIDTITKTINSNNSTNNTNKTTTSSENNTTNTTTSTTKNATINPGTFSVKNITDEELNDGLIGYIKLSKDNSFSLPGAIGIGEYTGTYTITNDKLICNVTTMLPNGVGSSQEASFTVTFKVINSNKLQLENISGTDEYNSKCIGKIFEK